MVDLFYIPVKSRKSRKLQKQQQQQQQQQQGSVASINGVFVENKMRNLGNPENNQMSKSMGFSPFGLLSNSASNLARFLEATIPSVPAQYFSKTTMKGWRTCDVEYQHYFTLGDLWESFRECSAYGAGVPLLLDGDDDGVVQYYVPYLSAIQLYGESSKYRNGNTRQAVKDGDSDDSKYSSDEGSSDYETVEDIYSSTLPYQCLNETNNVPFDDQIPSSLNENQHTKEGFFSDDSEAGNHHGQLLFQFFEQESPYSRETLTNKVAELAAFHTQLKTLRSCDLLPCSWMSVAWYPIYRIPSRSMLRDLDACFLTYHYLSMPSKGEEKHCPQLMHSDEIDGIPRFSLPAFGLAFYKFKAAIWTRNGDCECSLAKSLMQAADNWLRMLQVNHPDFEFFLSRGSHQR